MKIPRSALRKRPAALALFVVAIALFVGCSNTQRLSAPLAPTATPSFDLVSTIALSSTLHDPTSPNPVQAGEIYLIDPDGSNPRRLTDNAFSDGFATLSPDGKKIAFNSNRLATPSEPANTADMFVMNTDGTEQTFVARGASPSWSPDSKNIAYHASASGVGLPIKTDPGAATFDSDIFILNVDDAVSGAAGRINLTNSPEAIEDDADWSPDGQKIAFTSHSVTDNHNNSVTAEIYVMSPGGGAPVPLTHNAEEERAPSWSPDGSRICYMCRHGGPDFELCVMNADGSGQVQITNNATGDLTPTWSPDGTKIVFHRLVGAFFQLWTINPDGTGETQLTGPPGHNAFANWGELRIHVKSNERQASR